MGSQDYPCGKFGDCSFSLLGSIVRTDTGTQTDADEIFTLATLIGVSNYNINSCLFFKFNESNKKTFK